PESTNRTDNGLRHSILVEASGIGVNQAVITSAIDPSENLVGFQGDFLFDERVIQFDSEPVAAAGLTSSGWNLIGNVLDGPGPMRTLRLSAYSTSLTPLSGSGILFALRLAKIIPTEQRFPLIPLTPSSNFFFIDRNLVKQALGYPDANGFR